MKKNLNRIFLATVLVLAFLLPSLANAKPTIRINAGGWYGEQTPELEKRFFLDDLLGGFGFGRFNLDWENTSTFTLYPLGLEIFLPMGKNELVIGGNLINHSANITYTGFTFSPAISFTTLKNYKSRDYEAYLGYAFKIDKLRLTPRVGFRRHSESFNYEELTFGGNIAFTVSDNVWEASVISLFMAGELKYQVAPKFSILVDLMISPPFLANWGGKMNHERMVLGFPILTYDRSESGYEMSFNRFTLGAEVALTKKIKLQFGVRQESISVKYPDFYSLPIVANINTGAGGFGGFDLGEFITDLFIYSSSKTSEKGLLFASVSIDI